MDWIKERRRPKTGDYTMSLKIRVRRLKSNSTSVKKPDERLSKSTGFIIQLKVPNKQSNLVPTLRTVAKKTEIEKPTRILSILKVSIGSLSNDNRSVPRHSNLVDKRNSITLQQAIPKPENTLISQNSGKKTLKDLVQKVTAQEQSFFAKKRKRAALDENSRQKKIGGFVKGLFNENCMKDKTLKDLDIYHATYQLQPYSQKLLDLIGKGRGAGPMKSTKLKKFEQLDEQKLRTFFSTDFKMVVSPDYKKFYLTLFKVKTSNKPVEKEESIGFFIDRFSRLYIEYIKARQEFPKKVGSKFTEYLKKSPAAHFFHDPVTLQNREKASVQERLNKFKDFPMALSMDKSPTSSHRPYWTIAKSEILNNCRTDVFVDQLGHLYVTFCFIQSLLIDYKNSKLEVMQRNFEQQMQACQHAIDDSSILFRQNWHAKDTIDGRLAALSDAIELVEDTMTDRNAIDSLKYRGVMPDID